MVNLTIKVISIVVLILPPAFPEAEASNQTYTIGFGSCITEKREQPIWKAIKEENIDEFFFMGDNVYGDSDDGLLIEMKESYKKQKNMFLLPIRQPPRISISKIAPKKSKISLYKRQNNSLCCFEVLHTDVSWTSKIKDTDKHQI